MTVNLKTNVAGTAEGNVTLVIVVAFKLFARTLFTY